MSLWQKIKPYLAGGFGAAILIAAILISGEYASWRGDHPKPPKPVPQVLAPTAAELEMDRIIEDCLAVEVLLPTPERAKQIAKETGRPRHAAVTLEGRERTPADGIVSPGGAQRVEPDWPLLLVDARPYPESPAGGKLWVHLEQDGSTTVVALPNPEKPAPAEKFFQFGTVWEFGALGGIGSAGDTRGRGWIAAEPLRLGRVHLRGEVGVDLRAGEQSSYALAGFVWRSR